MSEEARLPDNDVAELARRPASASSRTDHQPRRWQSPTPKDRTPRARASYPLTERRICATIKTAGSDPGHPQTPVRRYP